MMDWTDQAKTALGKRDLPALRKLRSYFVARTWRNSTDALK